MADDPTFEPGNAGQVARLVAAMRELCAEAAALTDSASAIGPELAVIRNELAAVRGAEESQETLLSAIVAKQGAAQGQIIDALADMLDGTQAIYSLRTTPPPGSFQEREEPPRRNSCESQEAEPLAEIATEPKGNETNRQDGFRGKREA